MKFFSINILKKRLLRKYFAQNAEYKKKRIIIFIFFTIVIAVYSWYCITNYVEEFISLPIEEAALSIAFLIMIGLLLGCIPFGIGLSVLQKVKRNNEFVKMERETLTISDEGIVLAFDYVETTLNYVGIHETSDIHTTSNYAVYTIETKEIAAVHYNSKCGMLTIEGKGDYAIYNNYHLKDIKYRNYVRDFSFLLPFEEIDKIPNLIREKINKFEDSLDIPIITSYNEQ